MGVKNVKVMDQKIKVRVVFDDTFTIKLQSRQLQYKYQDVSEDVSEDVSKFHCSTPFHRAPRIYLRSSKTSHGRVIDLQKSCPANDVFWGLYCERRRRVESTVKHMGGDEKAEPMGHPSRGICGFEMCNLSFDV